MGERVTRGKSVPGEQGFSASALASLRAGPFVGGCPLQYRMLSVSGRLLPTPLNARSHPSPHLRLCQPEMSLDIAKFL